MAKKKLNEACLPQVAALLKQWKAMTGEEAFKFYNDEGQTILVGYYNEENKEDE